MPQIQHSHFNSPCKYTEMKAESQMFFADLSRSRSIMLDASVRRQSVPHYERGCNVWVDFENINAPEACGLSGAFMFLWMGWDQVSGLLPVIRLV